VALMRGMPAMFTRLLDDCWQTAATGAGRALTSWCTTDTSSPGHGRRVVPGRKDRTIGAGGYDPAIQQNFATIAARGRADCDIG
jgi:hypothetical protein